jgi:hypothetical protein
MIPQTYELLQSVSGEGVTACSWYLHDEEAQCEHIWKADEFLSRSTLLAIYAKCDGNTYENNEEEHVTSKVNLHVGPLKRSLAAAQITVATSISGSHIDRARKVTFESIKIKVGRIIVLLSFDKRSG